VQLGVGHCAPAAPLAIESFHDRSTNSLRIVQIPRTGGPLSAFRRVAQVLAKAAVLVIRGTERARNSGFATPVDIGGGAWHGLPFHGWKASGEGNGGTLAALPVWRLFALTPEGRRLEIGVLPALVGRIDGRAGRNYLIDPVEHVRG
jgi:hypothetical protein